MREIVKIAWKLLVICAVAGLCLAATFGFTNPKILQQQAETEKAGFVSLFPEIGNYEEIAFEASRYPTVTKAVKIKNKSNETIGFCILLNAKGYKGNIGLNVGFLPDGTISGVRIGTNSETVGLGSKVSEPNYYMQYSGKQAPLTLGTDITAISGATVSSRSVLNGVNYAKQVFASIRP